MWTLTHRAKSTPALHCLPQMCRVPRTPSLFSRVNPQMWLLLRKCWLPFQCLCFPATALGPQGQSSALTGNSLTSSCLTCFCGFRGPIFALPAPSLWGHLPVISRTRWNLNKQPTEPCTAVGHGPTHYTSNPWQAERQKAGAGGLGLDLSLSRFSDVCHQ